MLGSLMAQEAESAIWENGLPSVSHCQDPFDALQCCILTTLVVSWDMNGAASFSQRFGYMDKGYDFDNTISVADKAIN